MSKNTNTDADAATPSEVDDYRARQAAEYGRWVANTRIYHGSALAYRPGQAVPTSNVEKYGYDKNGLVTEVKAAATPATTTTTASTPPAGNRSQEG